MNVYTTTTTVRYAETDQMGVVYHANYLVWFELGRTALVEGVGFNYVHMEKEGFISPIVKVEASFHSPARYGDEVTISTWVRSYDGLRVTYAHEIHVGERLCVTGSSVCICVRKDNFRPVSMRRTLPDWDLVYQSIKET